MIVVTLDDGTELCCSSEIGLRLIAAAGGQTRSPQRSVFPRKDGTGAAYFLATAKADQFERDVRAGRVEP